MSQNTKKKKEVTGLNYNYSTVDYNLYHALIHSKAFGEITRSIIASFDKMNIELSKDSNNLSLHSNVVTVKDDKTRIILTTIINFNYQFSSSTFSLAFDSDLFKVHHQARVREGESLLNKLTNSLKIVYRKHERRRDQKL